MRCAVATCNIDNQSVNFDASIKFFRFPKDNNLCKQWLNACKRKDEVNVLHGRVCSMHFCLEDYLRNLKEELLNVPPVKRRRYLKPNAIPNCNLPVEIETSESGKRKHNWRSKKQVVEGTNTLLDTSDSGNGVDVSGGHRTSLDETCCIYKVEQSTSRDFGTNTENDDQKTIVQLKEEIQKLKNKNDIFKKIFSDNEIQKMQNPEKHIKWTIEDISRAIVIYSAGVRAYRILRKRGYPLPAISTLKHWCKKFNLEPGISKQVMMVVNKTDLTRSQRLRILSLMR